MTLRPDPTRPGVALDASGAVAGRAFAPGWPGGPWDACLAQGDGWARIGQAPTRDDAVALLCATVAPPTPHQPNLI